MSWVTENSQLLLGLAGIFGTVAGTWIGAKAGLQIERKRQEFERTQRELRERLEIMRAGRILDSELMAVESMLQLFILKKNQLWPDTIDLPGGSVWPELRGVVATAVDPRGWIALNMGFDALGDVRTFADVYRNQGYDHPMDLPAGVQALFEPPLGFVQRARTALHDVAYPDHVRLPEGHPLLAPTEAPKQ